MTNKSNIVFGTVAIVLILLAIYTINYPREVYAQTFQIISPFNYGIKAMSYQSTSDSVWVLSSQSLKTWLYQVDRTTQSITFSHNFTAQFSALSLGVAQDIWCGKTDCYITTNTGSAGGIARIPTENIPPNIFKGQNITGTFASPTAAGLFHISGRDDVSGGFGSVTMWVDSCSEAAATCDGQIRIIDGISMLQAATLPVYSSVNNFGVKVHELEWSGIAGTNDNDLIAVIGDGVGGGNSSANVRIKVYDLATNTEKCSVTPTLQPLGVDTRYVAGGDANNKFYVGFTYGIIKVYDDNCNEKQSFDTQLSDTGIRYVQQDAGRIFVQETGANAKIMQILLNSTGHLLTTTTPTYLPLPSSSQSAFDAIATSITVGNMILFGGNGRLWFPYTGDNAGDKKIGVLIYGAGTSGGAGSSTVCIETVAGSGILDLCFTDTDGNGVPDNGQAGALGAFRSNSNLTSFGTDVFCAFGINTKACEDKNIQTNGVGLTLLAILILISYAFLVSIHIFAQQKLARDKVQVMDALSINPLILLVMLIIDVSIAWRMGWIENNIFYTMEVVMLGLSAFGIYRKLTSGGGGA